MTPEAQRILIAIEVWRRIGCHHWADALAEGYKRHGDAADLTGVPDYPNDLNAMHEAEKVLLSEKWTEYWHHVFDGNRRYQGSVSAPSVLYMLHAIAAQRAEALLRTLNLWEEAP